jgi:hypothetical protein
MSVLHPASQPIHDFSDDLAAQAARLPFCALRPGEARALGGQLFSRGPLFVEEVARTLQRDGGLFPDVPITPDDLLGPQGRAVAWKLLAQQLQGLAALAQESYLKEQSGAIAAAFRVVKHVEAGALDPIGALGPADGEGRDRERLRLAALHGPLRLLGARQRDKARGRPSPPTRKGPARPAPADPLLDLFYGRLRAGVSAGGAGVSGGSAGSAEVSGGSGAAKNLPAASRGGYRNCPPAPAPAAEGPGAPPPSTPCPPGTEAARLSPQQKGEHAPPRQVPPDPAPGLPAARAALSPAAGGPGAAGGTPVGALREGAPAPLQRGGGAPARGAPRSGAARDPE